MPVAMGTRPRQRHQNGTTKPGRTILPQLAGGPLGVINEMLVCTINTQWQLPLNQEFRIGANSLHPRPLSHIIFPHCATWDWSKPFIPAILLAMMVYSFCPATHPLVLVDGQTWRHKSNGTMKSDVHGTNRFFHHLGLT